MTSVKVSERELELILEGGRVFLDAGSGVILKVRGGRGQLVIDRATQAEYDRSHTTAQGKGRPPGDPEWGS